MKKILFMYFTALCFTFYGCSEMIVSEQPALDASDVSRSGIIVRASLDETAAKTPKPAEEPVVFTGNDILWFNESTKELRFRDNTAMKSVFSKFSTFMVIKFYIDDEYMFSCMFFVISASTQICNSLVLFFNTNENKYYLLDGYPPDSGDIASAPNDQNSRDENMQNIKAEWALFIDRLKKEGRHVN